LFAAPTAGDDAVSKRLKEIDVDDTSPRAALELLAELKRLAEEA